MEIRIRISTLMESKKSLLGSIEDRLVRIPQKMREQLGLKTGLFLSLKGKVGDVYLQVANAYSADAMADAECLYVSDSTHSLLDLKGLSSLAPARDILIGCDPEFYLVDKNTGKTVSASNFFSHAGEVGSDCGLGELRPRPNYDPSIVTASINTLLKHVKYRIDNRGIMRDRNLYICAASHRNNVSAGFHVHFGLPEVLLRGNPDTPWLMSNMVSILDYYVGILSIVPEGNEDNKRRSARFCKYGKPGDHRHDILTLEYRVPGGHLLRHPVLTGGLLAISNVVMKDMLSRLQNYSDNYRPGRVFRSYEELRNLYPRLPNREEVLVAITSETITNAQKHMGPILEDLGRMIGFKERKDAILPYLNYLLEFMKGDRRYNEDISTNWGL